MIQAFRFWCAAPSLSEARTARELGDFARRAEALGYDALVMPDHLLATHAPLPLLTVVAAATERLRLVPFVLNNDLRRPGVLAHELASLDILSEGRLVAGIGAGWNQPEYEAAGVEYDPAPRRIDRLEAALGTLRRAWSRQEPFDAYPEPAQARIPILVGGGGRRLLSLAAEHADIVGLAPRVAPESAAIFDSMTAEATDQKLGWIRAAAGARLETLEVNTYPALRGGFRVTEEPRKAAEEIANAAAERGARLSAEQVLESPHTALGSVDAIVEKCRAMRERWRINVFMIGSEIDPFAPVVARLT